MEKDQIVCLANHVVKAQNDPLTKTRNWWEYAASTLADYVLEQDSKLTNWQDAIQVITGNLTQQLCDKDAALTKALAEVERLKAENALYRQRFGESNTVIVTSGYKIDTKPTFKGY